MFDNKMIYILFRTSYDIKVIYIYHFEHHCLIHIKSLENLESQIEL